MTLCDCAESDETSHKSTTPHPESETPRGVLYKQRNRWKSTLLKKCEINFFCVTCDPTIRTPRLRECKLKSTCLWLAFVLKLTIGMPRMTLFLKFKYPFRPLLVFWKVHDNAWNSRKPKPLNADATYLCTPLRHLMWETCRLHAIAPASLKRFCIPIIHCRGNRLVPSFAFAAKPVCSFLLF